MTTAKREGVSNATSNTNTNTTVNPLGLTKEVKKDLTRANLVKFLISFSIDTVWTKRHQQKFEKVLSGDFISPQLCELYTLGLFLTKRKIELITPEGKAFDFKPVVATAEILSDYTKSLKEKNGFSKANVKDFKKFIGAYALVLMSVAKGVAKYDNNVQGIIEDEGKQILSFLSLLVKL
ncbi:MAG: hypothetical protein GY814_05890, partial [Gammaproteobacteria bacterium]|nr:hypothetical protein [Gammaproteobacteria bacterium]